MTEDSHDEIDYSRYSAPTRSNLPVPNSQSYHQSVTPISLLASNNNTDAIESARPCHTFRMATSPPSPPLHVATNIAQSPDIVALRVLWF